MSWNNDQCNESAGLRACVPIRSPLPPPLALTLTLKPRAMQISPDASHFQHSRRKISAWLLVRCGVEGEQQRLAGSPNLVFVTKYQVDCRDKRAWQCGIKRSEGVFIPRPFLFPCLTPSLSSYVSVPSPLARFPLLHCVIWGLIPVLSFNIFLSSRWISENETLWVNQGVCVCV